jgi:threonine dehydrogenase-like Zn-dependent dehydrogenase
MRALQVSGPRRIGLTDLPRPEPSAGQVLVRLEALSICGTDMTLYRHPQPEESYPLTPGIPCHECAGTIVESRAQGWVEGQRVIYLPALNLNGGAEYVVGGPPELVALPAEGDLGEWLMCQPWGTVLFSLERAGPVIGKRVVVLGQGCIGLLFTMTLRRIGAAQIITTDLIDHRLEVSRRLGADLAINAVTDDAVQRVDEATEGQGADIVVEACGNPDALAQAVQMARMYGTVVLFGIPEEKQVPFDLYTALCKQLTLIGTVSATCEAPARPIRTAVGLTRQGAPDLSWLITHRLPFGDAARGYEMYADRADSLIKVVLELPA